MPKLWNDSIETHRQAVHDAVLDAAAELVAADGLSAITMSAIAVRTGIGRATLYKYFPDIDSIIAAWHERQVNQHLAQLNRVAERPATPGARLAATLATYVDNAFGQRDGHLVPLPHGGEHLRHARAHLRLFVGRLIAEAQAAGAARSDVAADELAIYCVAALDGAAGLTSKAARDRLLEITLGGLKPLRKSSRA